MHVPVKIASNTSPLAGLLYIQYQGKQKSTRSEHRSLTPTHLAFMNLGRSKRKTVVTVTMLVLSGILLLSVTTVTKSLSPEKIDRFYMFPHGDIQLTIQRTGQSSFSGSKEEYRPSRLQQQDNPLNSALIAKVQALDGIESVTPEHCVFLGIQYPAGMGTQNGSGDLTSCLTEAQCASIAPSIITGTADYDMLTKQDGVLLRNGVSNSKPGDTVEISGRGPDGKTFSKRLPVIGIYDPNQQQELYPLSTGSDFMMTDASVEELTGIKDQVGILAVSIEPAKQKQAVSEIKALADASDEIDMSTLEEVTKSSQAWFDGKTRPLSLIALILFLFGIISLINTALTNFTARKHEFALLQSVGMTRKQLQQMLRTENMFFALTAIMLTLIVGSIGGFAMCFHLKSTMHCIQYQFPVLITVTFISALLIAEFILTVCTSFMVGNKSLVERLGTAE